MSWVYSFGCRFSSARSCTSSCMDTVVMEVMGKGIVTGEHHEHGHARLRPYVPQAVVSRCSNGFLVDHLFEFGGLQDWKIGWLRPRASRRSAPENPRGPYAPSRERARFGSEFISALLRDFRQGGPAAIAKVRKYQPATYMKICALVIPKEMKLEYSGGAIKAMTDEELEAALEVLRELMAKRAA